MGGDIRRTSISLPQELLEQGQLLARLRRRNFSNYIADLIASDLAASSGELMAGSADCPEDEVPPRRSNVANRPG